MNIKTKPIKNTTKSRKLTKYTKLKKPKPQMKRLNQEDLFK